VIFLGSILLADFVLAPMLRGLLALGGMSTGDSSSAPSMPLASASIPLPTGAEGNLGEWMNVVLLYAYQVRRERKETSAMLLNC
jgi:hypothetical protein